VGKGRTGRTCAALPEGRCIHIHKLQKLVEKTDGEAHGIVRVKVFSLDSQSMYLQVGICQCGFASAVQELSCKHSLPSA
jgi:hypothetical protein